MNICGYRISELPQVSNLLRGVRLPLPAHNKFFLTEMPASYKNFWSLNVDEAVVTGILRNRIGKKKVEVLMPLNAQMKGVDLVLMNIKNKKLITIQVKGSRAYEPSKNELIRYKEGSRGWHFFSTDIIKNTSVDYFSFLVYVIEQLKERGRRYIRPHVITVSTENLRNKIKNKQIDSRNRYKFYFWIKPVAKKAIDINDNDNDYSEYLDKKGFDKLYAELQ